MSDPRIDWAKVELANKRREREDILAHGSLSLVIGILCWFCGGLFIVLNSLFSYSPEFNAYEAIFALVAVGGLLVAVRGMRLVGEMFPSAIVGVIVNILFLVLTISRVIRWLTA